MAGMFTGLVFCGRPGILYRPSTCDRVTAHVFDPHPISGGLRTGEAERLRTLQQEVDREDSPMGLES